MTTDMESGIVLRHYLVAFSALICGIASILCGGFGNRILDKILHLIIYVGISYESYYLQSLDIKKHRFRITIMSILLLVYSVLINVWLSVFCFVLLLIFLFISKKINYSNPNIFKDSPLIFGFKSLPYWLLILHVSYVFPLFLFT